MASTSSAPIQAEDDGITLNELLSRSISGAERVIDAPSPNDAGIQAILVRSLSDLRLCASLVRHLGILSPNESVEDVNTNDLRCLSVEYFMGALENLTKTLGSEERKERLEAAKTHFRIFLDLMDRYEVVPESERKDFSGPAHAISDPTRRRESKIAQARMEIKIKSTIKELKEKQLARDQASTSTNPLEQAEEILRPLATSLLKYQYLRSHAELSSIDMELELLNHQPSMSDLRVNGKARDTREKERDDATEEDTTWRLDERPRLFNRADGPLLDGRGKVLRPFTILPSSSSENPLSSRLLLRSQVFQPSHRLPTMSIDEFLDIEQERGNILTGGGPASSEAVEREREDKEALEEEDNLQGFEQGEEKLREKREWDEYTDTHRRGDGNRHNRG